MFEIFSKHIITYSVLYSKLLILDTHIHNKNIKYIHKIIFIYDNTYFSKLFIEKKLAESLNTETRS